MKFLALIVRYLNEPFFDEFVEYYLREGVDTIFVLYDTDSTMPISYETQFNPRVVVIESRNFKKRQVQDTNQVFLKHIKHKYTWVIFVDCDEFISTIKHKETTIREQLEHTYSQVDCVQIPWVMMSCNNREKDPSSILQHLTTRWNHNLKHPHPHKWEKGRCRFKEIEVKTISKCAKIDGLMLHHPIGKQLTTVESVRNQHIQLSPFFKHFREEHIQTANMVCFHYRIFSLESAKRKMLHNKLDGYKPQNLQYLLQSDHSEINDQFMKEKSIERFGKK